MAICKKCAKSGLLLKINSLGLCESCAITEREEIAEQLKTQTEELKYLRSLFLPEHQELASLKEEIRKLEEQKNQLAQDIQNKHVQIQGLETHIKNTKAELIEWNDEILVQSFGLYTPKYAFTTSEEYKKRLDDIREKQKSKIKYNGAIKGASSGEVRKWEINGSVDQGRKMLTDLQNLLLRAFNIECDELVNKVTYRNYESSKKRIESACKAVSRLGSAMKLSIAEEYKDLKLQELDLAYEYAHKKQEEKEEQKQIRAQMREEARIQKELEEERIKLEKEQTHYLNALAKIESQLIKNPDDADLMKKKDELAQKCDEIDRAIKDVDYREANKRAGYVYVISNIGAFGEGVYKIGMTRRLDPMERIDELGDASVPFKFDVHAMIFSEDAPALESALHKAFDDRKVNMVNARKEFFRVPLEEIKKVIRQNYDKTVEFIDLPDAEQYRVSEKMRMAI